MGGDRSRARTRDHALGRAITACALDVVVALPARDAEAHARTIYVIYEPMVDVVIALGHEDRSASWHVTYTLVEPNARALQAALAAADQPDLGDALLAIAAEIPTLRRV